MYNQIMLIGKIVNVPELSKTETCKSVTNLTLAVSRNYKNKDGVYETDFIDCTLSNGIAEQTTEYCKSGDLVGIRGRLETETSEIKKGSILKTYKIVVDKLTFLSSEK